MNFNETGVFHVVVSPIQKSALIKNLENREKICRFLLLKAV